MSCVQCGDVCTCARQPVTRSAVAEEPAPRWPATDAAWQDRAWRREIASRVRAHKKRRGHDDDDSLSLEFDEPAPLTESDEEVLAALAQAEEPAPPPPPSRYQRIALKRAQAQYESGNLIVFPPPAPPSSREVVEEALAEPIPETPRILEAPPIQEPVEQEPLFAAIELDAMPTHDAEPAVHLELESMLPVAPLAQQIVCVGTDTGLAMASFGIFAWIALSYTDLTLANHAVWGAGAALAGVFWAAYHFVFLHYADATPGMRMADCGLCTFDDTLPGRATRTKRAAALTLSMISLGMGFAWALVDEDHMGWHDRITRTYLRLL